MNCNTHCLVRNENGTSRRRRCACGTWIEHHRSQGGGRRTTCARMGCGGRAEVGAHVKFVDRRRGRGSWIVPFCRGCNHPSNTEAMFIDSRTMLVSARRSFTCEGG
ncbi:MAG: hypothetical protein ACI8Y6_000539 [Brevundimonas sp.]|jgi:hypothetical protein